MSSKLWVFSHKNEEIIVVGRNTGDCELYVNNKLADRKNDDSRSLYLFGETSRGERVKALIGGKRRGFSEDSLRCDLTVNDVSLEWTAIGAGS